MNSLENGEIADTDVHAEKPDFMMMILFPGLILLPIKPIIIYPQCDKHSGQLCCVCARKAQLFHKHLSIFICSKDTDQPNS